MQLGGLDVDGVRDVLRKMGNPLDALAPRFDIVRRLHELSEGDPLLVRLYVEALLPQGMRAAAFTPNDLLTLATPASSLSSTAGSRSKSGCGRPTLASAQPCATAP